MGWGAGGQSRPLALGEQLPLAERDDIRLVRRRPRLLDARRLVPSRACATDQRFGTKRPLSPLSEDERRPSHRAPSWSSSRPRRESERRPVGTRASAARRNNAPPASVERSPTAASGAAATPPAVRPTLSARANGLRCSGSSEGGTGGCSGNFPSRDSGSIPAVSAARRSSPRADVPLATASVEAGHLLDTDQHGGHPCFTEEPTASEDQHVRGVEWRPYARLDGRNQLSGSRSSVPMPADARSAAIAPLDMPGGFWRSTGSGLVSAARGFASPGRPVFLGMTSKVLQSRPRCRRGSAAQRASTSSAARSPAWIAPSM